MNSHELAKQLLAGPDAPVIVMVDGIASAYLDKPNEVNMVKLNNGRVTYYDSLGRTQDSYSVALFL